MNGDDLKRLRERRGLSRTEFAETLNEALGSSYNGESIARWERGRAPAKKVAAFLEELAVSELAATVSDGLDPGEQPLPPPDDQTGDIPPGPGPSAPSPQTPVVSGRGAYVVACEELWELIATGVGMVGAVTGSNALINDGAIIAQDKAALGSAWGKLAETNETFRRMLVGMTDGGAWLQVALVTGTTLSKCWQGHAYYTAAARAGAQASQEAPPEDGRVTRDHLDEVA